MDQVYSINIVPSQSKTSAPLQQYPVKVMTAVMGQLLTTNTEEPLHSLNSSPHLILQAVASAILLVHSYILLPPHMKACAML